MIRIRAFRAPEDEETCLKFLEGHKRLLEIHFGIAKITSSNSDWISNPNVIVVVAEDEKGEKIFGGSRVQVADGILPLPIETAIGHYDPKIYQLAVPGSCELGGMWNSIEVQGMGIGGIFLGRVCVVVASQLPVHTMLFLCAPVTTRMVRRVGGVLASQLGDNGTFYYPKEDFIATAMIHTDLEKLSLADPTEREIMLSLRENLHQIRMENGPKGPLEIQYQLELSKLRQ